MSESGEFEVLLEELWESHGGRNASQAYWNALAKLRAAWLKVSGENLPTTGNRAKDAFEQAIAVITERLSSGGLDRNRVRDLLDVAPGEEIAEALLGADMDDIPPKLVLQVLHEECRKLSDGRHPLKPLLKAVLDQLFTDPRVRRPRPGANRHWPRLLQYLRELEAQTDWSPRGRGVRLANAGGRGRVAREPGDPGSLSLIVDLSFI